MHFCHQPESGEWGWYGDTDVHIIREHKCCQYIQYAHRMNINAANDIGNIQSKHMKGHLALPLTSTLL